MASLTSVSKYGRNSPGGQNYISDSLNYTIKDSHVYTELVKIMLTLMDYFSPADRRTPWVTDWYCCSLITVC